MAMNKKITFAEQGELPELTLYCELLEVGGSFGFDVADFEDKQNIRMTDRVRARTRFNETIRQRKRFTFEGIDYHLVGYETDPNRRFSTFEGEAETEKFSEKVYDGD